MGIEIFEHNKSDRAARLWGLIKGYVKPGTTVLDIGCGNAPLAYYAMKDVPGVIWTGFDNHGDAVLALKRAYPAGSWSRQDYPDQFDAKLIWPYDIVIHIGVDKEEFSPIYKIHGDLIKAGYEPPVVLLESGFAEEYDGPFVACCKAMAAYMLTNRYEMKDSGSFQFDVAGHHLKERRWFLLEREVE
jgi:hypothetical protein